MSLRFRPAELEDLETLVAMLADDPLGSTRECPGPPLPEGYVEAFQAIASDPNNELVVATEDDEIIGMLQLTLLPSLTHRGAWRAQIEGVRVAAAHRGRGLGRALLREARRRAKAAGCRLLQLTTDKSRPEAIAFYRSIGFEATHEGMKAVLDPGGDPQ